MKERKYLSVSLLAGSIFAGAIACKLIRFWRKNLVQTCWKNVVFITGCDSGLGFNLALVCNSLNMTVICGCLDKNSSGAEQLRKAFQADRLLILELDLTNPESIVDAKRAVTTLFNTNKDYTLTALVNNAGIMCIGEFEWQTTSIFENQINVNLLGTMRITKEFLPLIRKHYARIINITSHCSLEALPGFAPYTASKAGLKFWNDSIRVELKKYGVHVIDFIPGSFVMSSNITSRQKEFVNEMRNSFSNEQMQFYGEYFNRYNKYLELLPDTRDAIEMEDDKLKEKFKHALLSTKPKPVYMHEPLRYAVYHFLFRWSPLWIKDKLMLMFLNMPQYTHKVLP